MPQIDINKINELKKEIIELNSKLSELSDDELQQVTGGSVLIGNRRYSSDTYSKLDLNYYHERHWASDNQESWYHPLITTVFNKCRKYSQGCVVCPYAEFHILTLYCNIRSMEKDNWCG